MHRRSFLSFGEDLFIYLFISLLGRILYFERILWKISALIALIGYGVSVMKVSGILL